MSLRLIPAGSEYRCTASDGTSSVLRVATETLVECLDDERSTKVWLPLAQVVALAEELKGKRR